MKAWAHCFLSTGIKAADSFMFHYLWNVCCEIKEQPHITGWYSPFNHLPSPPAPHPCNHVSSYIIAFQLLTGVWPLPPNMPNLIHVFPQRQRDALFRWGLKREREPERAREPERERERERERGMHQHAVSGWSYTKECENFPWILTRKSTAIFSRMSILLVM